MHKAESLRIIELDYAHVNMFGPRQFIAKLSQGKFSEISRRDTLFELFEKLIYCVHIGITSSNDLDRALG